MNGLPTMRAQWWNLPKHPKIQGSSSFAATAIKRGREMAKKINELFVEVSPQNISCFG